MKKLVKYSPWKEIAEMPVSMLVTPVPLLFYFDKVGKVAYGIPVLYYDALAETSRIRVVGATEAHENPSLYMVVPIPEFIEETPF